MTEDFCYSCGNHGCGLCDPKNHPIAWLYKGSDKELPSVALDHKLDDEQKKNCIPLAPQRTWVGLSKEDKEKISSTTGWHSAMLLTEEILMEKNT